jgi:hypothetical protein
MLWMMPVGWLNDLLAAASRTLEALPEHHPTHGTNKFTLLDDAVRGIGGAAAAGWVSEADWRQIVGLGGRLPLLSRVGMIYLTNPGQKALNVYCWYDREMI